MKVLWIAVKERELKLIAQTAASLAPAFEFLNEFKAIVGRIDGAPPAVKKK